MKDILDRFQNLGRYKGSAPHKPLLVLAVLDWIEELKLERNEIPIGNGLYDLFDKYWNKLYDPTKTGKIHYPIRYLQSDDLGWKVLVNSELLTEEKSKGYLKKNRAVASFDEIVWAFLQSPENRDLIRLAILNTYFPGKRQDIFSGKPYALTEYEYEFFEERQAPYRTTTVTRNSFVRDSFFRLSLLEIYRNTCAMSRMYLNPPGQILQACHITPFSETGNNGVRNGIVLCANLHAAFDNGFVGIGEDYEILVNEKLFEERPSPYSIERLRGEQIWLPEKEQFWPSQQLLARHRNAFFR